VRFESVTTTAFWQLRERTTYQERVRTGTIDVLNQNRDLCPNGALYLDYLSSQALTELENGLVVVL
jgi:hypothetical protein